MLRRHRASKIDLRRASQGRQGRDHRHHRRAGLRLRAPGLSRCQGQYPLPVDLGPGRRCAQAAGQRAVQLRRRVHAGAPQRRDQGREGGRACRPTSSSANRSAYRIAWHARRQHRRRQSWRLPECGHRRGTHRHSSARTWIAADPSTTRRDSPTPSTTWSPWPQAQEAYLHQREPRHQRARA